MTGLETIRIIVARTRSLTHSLTNAGHIRTRALKHAHAILLVPCTTPAAPAPAPAAAAAEEEREGRVKETMRQPLPTLPPIHQFIRSLLQEHRQPLAQPLSRGSRFLSAYRRWNQWLP
eukprot:GHVU01089361.1.p3 GENE.GHVU01089361.1~~GHVU01089361.1.p3  ORF type:complete len:118 (-),score=17.88 GHVU01089361.1:1018-1371(-)